MNSDLSYSSWRRRHKHTLETFPSKKVFLLFSGGKDSSLTLDFISRAGKEFGFAFEAHAGAYPPHRYPDEEKKRIEAYWCNRGVNIIWHDMGETDAFIEKAASPCLSCQKLRKRMLVRNLNSLIEDWETLILIACYTLWDVVSYSLEHILIDIFSNSDEGVYVQKNKRFMETAQRFYPLLNMKEGYTVFRPLIEYNNKDIIRLIAQQGIPTLSIPCKFKDLRPKRILERYYEKIGICFEYDQVLNFARKSLSLPNISTYTSMEKEEYLGHIF